MRKSSHKSTSRRDVVGMALAAAAMASAGPAYAAEPSYDLVIKGGRVIDPLRRMNAMADVAMRWGRIVAVRPDIKAKNAEVLDATGKLVTPGLIDVHSHFTPPRPGGARPRGAGQAAVQTPGVPSTQVAAAAGGALPVTQAPTLPGPQVVLSDCVTGWIEAGSRGADNIEVEIPIARAAPQTAALLVNIGRQGMGGANTDTLNLELADVDACRKAIAAHRDLIVGIKARLSPEYAAEHDYETLRRAEEASRPFNVPVMIHIGNTFTPLGKLLDLLKPGDIVSHIWVPGPHNMFDASGHIIPEVIAARKRGVRFDVGHGRLGHFSWEVAEQSIKQGFIADTTSTDWSFFGHDNGTLGMPIQMSNLLSLGLSLERAVAMATINSANTFPIFHGRGTLKSGSPADVAVLDLRQGSFELTDSVNVKRTASQKLFGYATVIGGKLLWQDKT
jgi:dihydroorotase